MRIAWKPLGWGLLALLAVVAVSGALALRHWWSEALAQNGIETLEWQGLNVSPGTLSVHELTFAQSQRARDIVLHARELTLGWHWAGWQPELTVLTATHVKLDWYTKPGKQPTTEPSQPTRWPPELPVWLPSDINIQQFDAVIPGVGVISGNVKADLKVRQGQWQPDALKADLTLNHPAAWINKIPEQVRPYSFTLSIRSGPAIASPSSDAPAAKAGSQQNLLPLNVALRSRGGADMSIDSHLAVAINTPWAVQLGNTQVSAALPELTMAGWLLTKPSVKFDLTGWINTSGVALTFGESSVLDADKVQSASGPATGQGVRLNGFRADLAETRLKANYNFEDRALDSFTLAGPVGLKAQRVEHPQLLPQAWQFSGRLDSNQARTRVTGVLKAASGALMNLDTNVPYRGGVTIGGTAQVGSGQQAGALSRTFTAWPSLLTVSGGKVSAHVAYKKPRNGPEQTSGNLVFTDFSGTYDRTAWNDMNGSADFLLGEGRIRVVTPGLTIETLNPGLPVGPVSVAGHYEASLTHLGAGQLTLTQANSGALGGELQIQPGSWNFAQAPVTLPVILNKLSLARLLQVYPAEGLAGTGTLSGTVPIQIGPATGLRVKQGHIGALKPGGRLQITAERLKALASQSASMKLVAQALENFHYSVLTSGINYDEDGTLVLNLHLKGSSPDVGQGQPVVLNVNLEENVPALLTSLQLSGRVSDAVTERIKKLLQKRKQRSDELLQ